QVMRWRRPAARTACTLRCATMPLAEHHTGFARQDQARATLRTIMICSEDWDVQFRLPRSAPTTANGVYWLILVVVHFHRLHACTFHWLHRVRSQSAASLIGGHR